MGVTDVVKDFVFVTVFRVVQPTIFFGVVLVFFVVFVGAEGDFELFVLVSDVSHNSIFRLVGSVVHNCVQIV